MKLKTRKAISKRLKITKKRKMVRRPAGQDHFRAKKSGKQTQGTYGIQKISAANQKTFEKAASY